LRGPGEAGAECRGSRHKGPLLSCIELYTRLVVSGSAEVVPVARKGACSTALLPRISRQSPNRGIRKNLQRTYAPTLRATHYRMKCAVAPLFKSGRCTTR